MPHYLLIPALAAVLFAVAVLFIKRGYLEGATPSMALHTVNLVIAALFLPLLAFQDRPLRWDLWFQPLTVGVALFVGTWFAALAIRLGDVSLVTPVSSIKVVVVAILVGLLLGEWPGLRIGCAAGLAFLGLAIATRGGDGRPHGRAIRKNARAILAMISSVVFLGAGDVLIQKWAGSFGPYGFATAAAAVPAFLSLVFMVAGPARCGLPSRRPLGWLVAGGAVAGIQSILMTLTLALFNDATGIHILYSFRGLWAVAMAAVFAKRLGIPDTVAQSPHLLAWRILGAMLLSAAAAITIIERTRAAG